MDTATLLSRLSPAQLRTLAACKIGRQPPPDLLSFGDPRLVRDDGSRTATGDALVTAWRAWQRGTVRLKKGPTHPNREGVQYLSQLAKAALVDAVCDLFDLAEGEWDVESLRAFLAPRAAIRGDRLP